MCTGLYPPLRFSQAPQSRSDIDLKHYGKATKEFLLANKCPSLAWVAVAQKVQQGIYRSGWWFDRCSSTHANVSLVKIMNPELLSIIRVCMSVRETNLDVRKR